MQKLCGRCTAQILCLADDVSNCDCLAVRIAETTRIFLSKTNYGCLCVACLQELDRMVVDIEAKGNVSGAMLEGLHFYYEGSYKVMTEYYHMERGYCCGSGCRHCAYGGVKIPN